MNILLIKTPEYINMYDFCSILTTILCYCFTLSGALKYVDWVVIVLLRLDEKLVQVFFIMLNQDNAYQFLYNYLVKIKRRYKNIITKRAFKRES